MAENPTELQLPRGVDSVSRDFVQNLGTEAVLREVKPVGMVEDDLSIIQNIFGSNAVVRGFLTRWKNRNKS